MLTIAWDVDDVLNGLMASWLEQWWKVKNSGCVLKHEELTQNPPHHLLGVEQSEYLQSLDAYRLSEYYTRLEPDPKIKRWFSAYGHAYRHIVLTAVPRIAAPTSAGWVLKHFGDWIRAFHFVPTPRPRDLPTPYERSKADYLKWLNHVDIFIDDHPANIEQAKALGIKCLMPSRPWNSGGISINEILDILSSDQNQRLQRRI